MEENKFKVVLDGNEYDAYVISNFSIGNDYYCAYAVDTGDKMKNVYCDRVINNSFVKIEEEDERRIIDKIVNNMLKALEIKGGNNNG